VRGLFVTGTDTGAGKSVLSAALLAAIAAAGESVRAHKPVVTGLDSAAAPGPDHAEPGPDRARSGPDHAEAWPPDHELLARAAGMRPENVTSLRYGPAVSPHLAAALAGERIEPAQLLAAARGRTCARGSIRTDSTAITDDRKPTEEAITIVEGVGGLLVPLAEDYTVADLATQLGLPLLIAARPGLGTINHTLLTLHAARTAGLVVRAVVLTPWAAEPAVIEQSNRETIARLGDIEVAVLPFVPTTDVEALARAGATLPWRRWLDRA
jgi:dethiobiotin synthetase